MKLITEEIEQVEVIVESRNGKKNLYIEGVFLQSEMKNRNGRMYPKQTLMREVNRYNENFVEKGRALGSWVIPTARLSILTEYLIKLFLSKKMEITL